MGMSLKELVLRVLVALVGVPLTLYSLKNESLFLVLVIVMTFFGTLEFVTCRTILIKYLAGLEVSLSSPNGIDKYPLPQMPKTTKQKIHVFGRSIVATLLPISVYFSNIQYPAVSDKNWMKRAVGLLSYHPILLISLSITLLLGISAFAMFDLMDAGLEDKKVEEKKEKALNFISAFLDYAGIMWIAGGCCCALILCKMSTPILVFIFLGNWACDTFAMIIGKRFGRIKLCPKLSPNKTVEGAFGAIFGGFLVGLLYYLTINNILFRSLIVFVSPSSPNSVYQYSGMKFRLTVDPPNDFSLIMFFSLIIGIAAIVGDLIESWLKRICFVKDSGIFFGAHGGVLDRIDGLLWTMSAMYVVILITTTATF